MLKTTVDKRARILLVEDDRVLVSMLLHTLTREEYWARAVASVAEGLEVASSWKPDIVILDRHLPDGDGLQLCRSLHSALGDDTPRIMVLTGAMQATQEKVEAFAAGVDEYLIKPVPPPELIARLEALLKLKKAEDALRDSEVQFRLAFENAVDPILWLDAETGIILRANPAAGGMFKCPSEELLGLHQSLLRPLEEMENGEAIILQGLETPGIPLLAEFANHSGERMGVQVTVSTTTMARRPVVQAILRDVTEGLRTERALRESEERHRRLFETLPVGVMHFKGDGRTLDINEAAHRILGLTLETLPTAQHLANWWDAVGEDGVLLPEADRPAFLTLLTGLPVVNKVIGLMPAGTSEVLHWMKTSTVPTFRPGERLPFEMYCTFEEITQSRLAALEIIDLNRSLEARVSERTRDLEEALAQTRREIAERERAETARRASEERYRQVFLHTSDGIFVMDLMPDGRFQVVDFNPREAAMLGVDSRWALGQPVEAFISPDQARKVEANYLRCLEQGMSMDYDEELDLPSGRVGSFHTTLIPIQGREGIPSRILGMSRETTQERAARATLMEYQSHLEEQVHLRTAALKSSEARIKAVLSTVADGIVSVDGDGKIDDFNPAAEQIFGYTKDEIQGMEMKTLVPEEGQVGPEAFLARYRSLEDESFGNAGHYLRGRHKDGTPFPIEMSLSHYEFEGRLCFTAVFRDITQRQRMEDALRESERKFRDLVENQGEGFILVDLENRFIFANPAAEDLLGVPNGGMIGKSIYDFLTLEGLEVEQEQSRLRHATGRRSSYETRIRRPDGGERDILVTATPQWSVEGAIVGASGILLDITGRKEAEEVLMAAKEAADAANLAKSTFLANMSHEIRTPLNAVLGFHRLVMETSLSRKQREYMEKAGLSARNLLAIINDILDFSKIEADRVNLESIAFDPEDMLSGVVNSLSVGTLAKGLPLVLALDPDLPNCLIGDPLRLGQVLLNLGSNAVKFTSKGEVAITLAVLDRTPERVRLGFEVRDTGIGMTPAQMEGLFTPFTQADDSTTRTFGGTGLGLTISQRLVHLMGGVIKPSSEVGVGSSFTFELTFAYQEAIAPTLGPMEALNGVRVHLVSEQAPLRGRLANRIACLGLKLCGPLDWESLTPGLPRPPTLLLLDWNLGPAQVKAHAQRAAEIGGIKVLLVSLIHAAEIDPLLREAGLDGKLLLPATLSNIHDLLAETLGIESTNPRYPDTTNALLALKGIRVLLVEDNDFNQQVAMEILQGAGMDVAIAANGQEAVGMARAGSYDVVLMDLQMPVMDGYQASVLIRKEARLADLPIIAMSADVLEGVRERVVAAGMTDYVTKPFDPQLLFHAMARHLHRNDGAAPSSPEPVSPVPACELPDGRPGLDIRAALTRLGIGPATYLTLLRRFSTGQEGVLDHLFTDLEAGDVASAQRNAHSLKGAAGNLGATRLAEAAKALESALKASAAEEWTALALQLRERFEEVLGSIASLAGGAGQETPPPAGPVVWGVVLELVEALRQSLERDSPAAQKELARLEVLLRDTPLAEALAPLKRHAHGYDFPQALKALPLFMETLEKVCPHGPAAQED
jgi:PAS domain S-box-containing protein